MRLLGKAILASIIVALTTVSGFACDCVNRSETESFAISDAVFIGEVIRVDRSVWNTTFQVRHWLKGASTNTVVIHGSSTCDEWFYPGLTYIVYAREFEGKLQASTCLSTRQIDYLPRLGNVEDRSCIQGRSFAEIAVVTGVCVGLSLSLGLLVGAIRKRFR